MTRLARPTGVTAAAGALTLASITATAGFLFGKYEILPPGLPVHFRAGRPDRFMLKSVWVVLTPVWTQLFLALIIGGVAALLLWRARPQDVLSADEHAPEDRERMLHATEALALLGFVWITFQLVTAYSLTELWMKWVGGMGPVYSAGLAVAVVASIFIAARAMMKIGRPAARHAGDQRIWRFRALYFNPGDPALFVPSTRGYGLTLNFGRPMAIVVMLAILLAGLGGPYLLARALLR